MAAGTAVPRGTALLTPGVLLWRALPGLRRSVATFRRSGSTDVARAASESFAAFGTGLTLLLALASTTAFRLLPAAQDSPAAAFLLFLLPSIVVAHVLAQYAVDRLTSYAVLRGQCGGGRPAAVRVAGGLGWAGAVGLAAAMTFT